MTRSDPWALQRWALSCAMAYELPPTEAHVLLVLAVHANVNTGVADPLRFATIAAEARRGDSVVYKALADLEGERGLIERRRRGPGRLPVTRLLAPWLTSGEPEPTTSRSLRSTEGSGGPEVSTDRSADLRPAGQEGSDQPEPVLPGERPEERPEEPPHLEIDGSYRDAPRAHAHATARTHEASDDEPYVPDLPDEWTAPS